MDIKTKASAYVKELFYQYYGIPDLSPILIDYYVNILINSPATSSSDPAFLAVVQQVVVHIQSLGIECVKQYQLPTTSTGVNSHTNSTTPRNNIPISPSFNPQVMQGTNAQLYEQTNPHQSYRELFDAANPDSSTSTLDPKTVKEYVGLLFQKHTGKLGDPASTQFLIKSLMDKSYTFTQAEFHVKFSREGKLYSQKVKKKQEEDIKLTKLKEYIAELFRVYAPHFPNKEFEIENLSSKLFLGAITLQDAEDEVKLFGLTSIKSPSNTPK